jgi:hypothetical protein
MKNIFDREIKLKNQKFELKILSDILHDDVLDTNKLDWVFLTSRVKIPKELKIWMDKYCKLRGITYTKYIRQSLIDRQKTKRIFLKLIQNQNLTNEDYFFIEQLINE